MSLEHSPAKQTQIISRREFRKRLGDISRTTEFRMREADPNFPQVVWITPGKSGYFEDEAAAYIRARPRRQRLEDVLEEELPAEAPSAVNGKRRRSCKPHPEVGSPP
jgi:predicted DNA-binding transcriptional regulator AlpA